MYCLAELCDGRHPMPDGVHHHVFPGDIENLWDFNSMLKIAVDFVRSISGEYDGLILYITGLTSATLAVVNACALLHMPLQCAHWDRVRNVWHCQDMIL